MNKHSPGPWKVVSCNENFEIQTMDNKCLADAWSYAINSNVEEMEANAKLFAAAPDLLDTLIKLHESLAEMNDSGDVGRMLADQVEIARAAIAKATK